VNIYSVEDSRSSLIGGSGVLSTPGVHSIEAVSKNINNSLGILTSDILLNSLHETISSSDSLSYHLKDILCHLGINVQSDMYIYPCDMHTFLPLANVIIAAHILVASVFTTLSSIQETSLSVCVLKSIFIPFLFISSLSKVQIVEYCGRFE
jgi:hypothetical protein